MAAKAKWKIGKKYTANAHLEYSQRNPGIQSRQLHGVHRSDQVVLGEVLMGMMRIMLLHARLALGDVVSTRCCTSATKNVNSVALVDSAGGDQEGVGQSHKRTRCR